MSFRASFRRTIRIYSYLPVVSTAVRCGPVRWVLSKIPGIRGIYSGYGWELAHPFDVIHGTDTSGHTADANFIEDPSLDAHAHGYAGSQPGVMRQVLGTLRGVETCTFVDLGCGKGRPLLVATEFPFRDIVGVELSTKLADIARNNAAKFAALYPNRTKVRIVVQNAAEYSIPDGDVVFFLYNPFEQEPLRKVLANVEAALASERRRIFIVYFHPNYRSLFDESPVFVRRFDQAVPYPRNELGFGPGTEESVVIWEAGEGLPVIC